MLTGNDHIWWKHGSVHNHMQQCVAASRPIRLNGFASRHHAAQPGFALIATISVMTLLVLVALAMLSLSSITLRSDRNEEARAEARANARLALMLALGELQKSAGDDRRITVPASQWDTDISSIDTQGVAHSRLTGVYTARSIEEELANTLSDNYYNKDSHFLTWLASHKNPDELRNTGFVIDGSFSDAVVLETFPASEGNQLKAGKVNCPSSSGGEGGYAWAVISDESQRGSLPRRGAEDGGGVARAMEASGLPGAKGHQVITGLGHLEAGNSNLNAYLSHAQYSLLDPVTTNEEISRQITPYSYSLLTDVKRGGFRKCLNLLLELEEDQLPAEYQQMETYTAKYWGGQKDLNARKLSAIVSRSIPEDYDTLPIALLHNYYRIHRLAGSEATPHRNDGTNVTLTAKRPSVRVIDLTEDKVADRYWRGYGHGMRIAPVIARMRDVVWVMSEKVPGSNTSYQLALISFPIVTVWNPYNIDITFDRAWIQNVGGNLTEAKVKIGTRTSYSNVSNVDKFLVFGTRAGKPAVQLSPGETRVFFPDFSNLSEPNVIPMISEWPNNIADILTYGARYKYTVPGFLLRGQANTPVEIGIRPTSKDNSHSGWTNISFYADAWFSDIQENRGTKFGAWTYDLKEHVNGGYIPEVPKALTGQTMGGLFNRPTPVGIISLGIKAIDHEQPGLGFVFDYPQRINIAPHYALAGEDLKAGMQASAMSVEVIPLNGDTDLSKHVNTMEDERGIHDYLGYSYTPTRGSSYMTLCELPQVPLRSLGQLQHLPLQDENWHHDDLIPNSPTWTFGIGNSWAHPWLDSNKLTETKPIYLATQFGDVGLEGRRNQIIPMIDRLWVANSLLFDSYTFTTMAPQNNAWYQASGNVRDLSKVAEEFFAHKKMLPHTRLIPWPDGRTAEQRSNNLITNGRPSQDAYRLICSEIALEGGFNINSTHVEAWKLLLASTFKNQVPRHSHDDKEPVTAGEESDRHVISRYTIPNGSSIDQAGDPYRDGFNGYREINTRQIEDLAEAIVREVKKRGPFRSLGEFVNRRRGNASDPDTQSGALQAALESKDVHINDIYGSETFTPNDFPDVEFPNPYAIRGSKARGLPGFVSQADVLSYVAPMITARGDTFVLRAYGESKNAKGKVRARAWCEAVVQRTPEFVDKIDDKNSALAELTSEANKLFGRRFYVVSFRWLNKKEVK